MSKQQPTAADIVMEQQAIEITKLKYQNALLQIELAKLQDEEKEGE